MKIKTFSISILFLAVITTIAQESESIFLDAVVIPEHAEQATTASFGTLAFDFSQQVEQAYNFTQNAHTTFNLQERQIAQDITGSGRLIVRSQGMNTGEIELKDIAVKNPEWPAEMAANKMPSIVIKQVQEDGKSANTNNPMADIVLWLFPMTGKEIQLGKSEKIPRTFPVAWNNQTSQATGSRLIHAKQHIRYQERHCLLFTITDTLDELNPPIADVTFTLRGKGYFIYDYQKKAIIIGRIAMRMRLLTKGEVQSDSDNFISIDRRINP